VSVCLSAYLGFASVKVAYSSPTRSATQLTAQCYPVQGRGGVAYSDALAADVKRCAHDPTRRQSYWGTHLWT